MGGIILTLHAKKEDAVIVWHHKTALLFGLVGIALGIYFGHESGPIGIGLAVLLAGGLARRSEMQSIATAQRLSISATLYLLMTSPIGHVSSVNRTATKSATTMFGGSPMT